MEQITSVPLVTCYYNEDNRLSGQKVGAAGVVVDHSKASGLVEVFDLIVPTFYRVLFIMGLKSTQFRVFKLRN